MAGSISLTVVPYALPRLVAQVVATPAVIAAETPVPSHGGLSVSNLVWAGVAAACASLSLVVFIRAWVRMRRFQRNYHAIEFERDTAIREARDAIVGRRAVRFELDAVSSLLPGQPPKASLAKFLKTILPHPSDGFAAIVKQADGATEVVVGRGQVPGGALLSELSFDSNGSWRAGTRFPNVFLIPAGQPYWLLASQLAPTDIPEETGRAVVERCRQSLGDRAAVFLGRVADDTELRTTVEMLTLREAADDVGRNPDAPVSKYLDVLLTVVPFDRASLFLIGDSNEDMRESSSVGKTPFDGVSLQRIGQAGTLVHAGVEQVAGDHEQRLARRTRLPVEVFTGEDLVELGVDSLASAGASVLLQDSGGVRGVLCLTAAKPVNLDEAKLKLLGWVGNHVVGLLSTVRDRLKMQRRATRDGLTGLYNRAELDRVLTLTTSTATVDRPCTLMMFDLDHFKNVNDTYGHQAGDAAIQHVAAIMQEIAGGMRTEDQPFVARYGGEELAILLPTAPLSAGLRVAEQVRKRVATSQLKHEGKVIPLTISAGVASGPSHGATAEKLLEAADSGLYASKQLGRNRITDADRSQSLDAMKSMIGRRE